MRTPSRMAARMAGAVVAAVLAAAPGVPEAGEGLPVLLPEAVGNGAVDARDAPPEGEGSAIGDVPAEVVPAEVVPAGAVSAQPAAGDTGAEDTRAEDTRAGDTRAGAGEEAAAADVPDRGRAIRAEAARQPVSRLLRALAETSGAALSAPDGGAARAAPVYAAEGCPRALLRRLLAGAADDAGALTALGIEREVLTLCRERQEIVTGLLETEARLGELRAASRPPVPVRSTPAIAPPPAPGRAQPSPLRSALSATAETLVPEKANEPVPRAGQAHASARVSPARVSPPYAWFSIIGTSGALRAGVTDGTGVWFVREGDVLPGGSTVSEIAGLPPAVRVSAPGGTAGESALPYRARPGGVP